jgi:hypothetical protein
VWNKHKNNDLYRVDQNKTTVTLKRNNIKILYKKRELKKYIMFSFEELPNILNNKNIYFVFTFWVFILEWMHNGH